MNINEIFQIAYEHLKAGNLLQAKNLFEEILKAQPDNFNVLHLLGVVAYQLKHYDSAIQYTKKALQLNPTSAYALYTLGNAYREIKQFEEAIVYYQKALLLNPGFVDVYYNLGTIFQDKNKLEEAITYYQKVLQLNPHDVDAYYNLGNAFRDQGQFEKAIACYQKALQLNPDLADVYNNLGTAYLEKGRLDEAERHYRYAIQREPHNFIIHQNLTCMMLYNFRYDARTIFSAHVQLADRFEKPLALSVIPHSTIRTPDHKLKIGYVSPDFRKHSVAYFIEPVLAAHSREDFEVYCYSTGSLEDEVTERIRQHADHWQRITDTSDEQAAELIRRDRIDILIDLAGHTSKNRILIFARKPAPVQASWLGYPATTGFSTIDYKIVDMHTDPSGMTEQFYTEELIRLPGCFLCYLPDSDSPEVNTLPALDTGHITFGSLNNWSKVSPEVITCWTKILNMIGKSHLILKAKAFSDKETYNYALDIFAAKGITPERIELLPLEPSTRGHLATYNRIDIGLDTFPYNGTTTTCEAMWMGVPVITLEGDTHVSRVGCSLLSHVGLSELIAKTQDEYIEKTLQLANDVHRLQKFREGLRSMMTESPLTDAKGFTAHLEQYYRQVWEKWCKPEKRD